MESPRWLNRLERPLGWIALPHIAVLLVTLQALGFLMVSSDPLWISRLALIPELVSYGNEYWRLITFLALPLSTQPIWVLFTLWFLYFLVQLIESEWGAFRTTFYVLVSWLVTVAFSFAFGHPITQVTHLESTLFLAAAALYPEVEVRLFFAIPVKLKWLAALSLVGLAWTFLRSDWADRIYLVAVYSNALIFFGPAGLQVLKNKGRQLSYRRKMRRP